ncbi:hypothetical protein [Mucilaginibacter psychrotolerans]|uniref:Leucine-rich repeat domain-containing protein n=1 Tax=Mucilaginibacter psychrotolerans TaxID=1524096 RepID=A0A4Y8SQC0_9SPHI|nr:hypothetical protein [Mucilaginibacter psychrotolerans]TFF40800.1 hypothetical protein E2R66_01065 [Mucilaginibacter psychrotolerans]
MDWRYNTIWFEQLAAGNYLNQDLKEKPKIDESFTRVEYAILWYLRHKESAFDNLPGSDKLSYLELNSANLKDLQGVGKFVNLKRLELRHCLKLETDLGLSELSASLQYLYIGQSKKFTFTDELLCLKGLRVLCLNACGPIENLSFLKHFPNLIDFRFVDTNILDGDLTPLIEHPTIRSVGFLNKRHYNLKDDKVDKELAAKGDNSYRHFAYKEQYSTSRYDY